MNCTVINSSGLCHLEKGKEYFKLPFNIFFQAFRLKTFIWFFKEFPNCQMLNFTASILFFVNNEMNGRPQLEICLS